MHSTFPDSNIHDKFLQSYQLLSLVWIVSIFSTFSFLISRPTCIISSISYLLMPRVAARVSSLSSLSHYWRQRPSPIIIRTLIDGIVLFLSYSFFNTPRCLLQLPIVLSRCTIFLVESLLSQVEEPALVWCARKGWQHAVLKSTSPDVALMFS